MADSLSEQILKTLAEGKKFNTYEYASELGVDHQLVVGAVKRLTSLEDVNAE